MQPEVLDKIRTYLLYYLEEKGYNTKKPISCLNPNHEDKNPSMVVAQASERGWRAYCLSCGYSADVFTAYSILEGKPISGSQWVNEVVIPLAKKYGVALPKKEISVKDLFIRRVYSVYELVANLIQTNPKFMGAFGKQYVEEHEWTRELISILQIGTLDYETLTSNLDQEDLTELGLDRKDLFDGNNLIFPIKDKNGNIIRFFARVPKDKGKFISTSTNLMVDLWRKKGHLYLSEFISKKKSEVLLVEGQGDAVTLLQHGFKNVVASMGCKNISSAHIDNLILRGISRVTIILDGDEAGLSSGQSLIEKDFIKGSSVNIDILVLPEGDDPDSFIRKNGKEAFQYLLDNARLSPFQFILSRIDSSLPAEKICEDVIPYIASVTSPIRRELMAKELHLFLSDRISLSSIIDEIEKLDETILLEKNQKSKAIVNAACRQAGNDFSSGRIVFDEAVRQLDEIDKQYNGEKGSSICLQRLYDNKKFEEVNRSSGGYELGPGLIQISDMLSGGRWTGGRVILVAGVRNVGKSTFIDEFIWEAISNEKNNAIAYILSIDDTFSTRIKRLVSLNVRDKYFEQNMVGNPHLFVDMTGDQSIFDKREFGYTRVGEAIAQGRLIIEDSKDGVSLEYVYKRASTIRRDNPDKNIIIAVDNFHDCSDYGNLGESESVLKRISFAKTRIAEELDTLCLFSAEYRKLQDFSRPGTDDDLVGSRKLGYAAHLTIHLYSDLEYEGDKALYVHEHEGNYLPRVIGTIGKNKITDKRLGSINLDFFPANAFFESIPYERAIQEEKARRAQIYGEDE